MTRSDTDATVIGVYEPAEKSGGWLRNPDRNYEQAGGDCQVPAKLASRWGLRGGELVEGSPGRNRNQKNRQKTIDQIVRIDGMEPDDHLERKRFEDLVPIDPERQIKFETAGGPMTMRVVDLLTPIGFGQRGLIVAPPRSGKTVLIQQMGQAVLKNYPDVHVIMLLVDERPEEVTDMRRNVNAEIVASSNDHPATAHVRIAKLVTNRCRRLVEAGRDVFLLLDSLTRLGRAFNSVVRSGGRIMSGGLDINALGEPKSIFGAARNIEHGGSLTIVATALVETGSRMDDVIFNEFKGTGNMELILSRDMANRRVWPAIDLNPSGTRKEERLLSAEALEMSHHIRRQMQGKDPIQSMEMLLREMDKFGDNGSFIASARPTRYRR